VTKARYCQLFLSHSINTSPEISVPCSQELGPWCGAAKELYTIYVWCTYSSNKAYFRENFLEQYTAGA